MISKTNILYKTGGCGKTSLLAKSSAMSLDYWFAEVRPTNIIRFLGTTPDSSALTPTLISICQQVISTVFVLRGYINKKERDHD